jgi:hypothetical protein
MSYRLPWQSQKEQIHKRIIALAAAKGNISINAMLKRSCLSCLAYRGSQREERKQANTHLAPQARAEPVFRRRYALLSEARSYPIARWQLCRSTQFRYFFTRDESVLWNPG